MGTEEDFQILFQKLVDRYELPPDVAEKLLQIILFILRNGEENKLDLCSMKTMRNDRRI